jgi:hypothetical protein
MNMDQSPESYSAYTSSCKTGLLDDGMLIKEVYVAIGPNAA